MVGPLDKALHTYSDLDVVDPLLWGMVGCPLAESVCWIVLAVDPADFGNFSPLV